MGSDFELVQIVDAALAEAARLAGPWLACRPGCAECCIGPFAITPLDAQRLRAGLAELERGDPERAARVRARVAESAGRLRAEFPGETLAQVLGIDECTALVLSSPQEAGGGSCRVLGAGSVSCYRLEAASGVDPAGRVGGRAGAPALLRAWIEHAPAEIAGCLAGRQ